MNTVLQVPINKDIRDRATSQAEKMGFSSLQEVVRLFVNKIASGSIDATFEPVIKLSTKNDKRYSKMIREIESGKMELKSFTDVDSMMKYLNSNDD